MKNPHFDKIEHQEPIGHSCPIGETPIFKVQAEGKTWTSCECMAEEDFFGEGVMISDSGFHQSISEIWGEEVRYMMLTRPDSFPPESLPGPVEDID